MAVEITTEPKELFATASEAARGTVKRLEVYGGAVSLRCNPPDEEEELLNALTQQIAQNAWGMRL